MSSNNYIILLRCITVLFLCSKIKGNWEKVNETVKETLKMLKMPTAILGEDSNGEVVRNLKGLVDWMLGAENGIEFHQEDILARIRINVKDDATLLHEVELSLTLADDVNKARNRIRSIVSELSYENAQINLKGTLNKMMYKINQANSGLERKDAIRELQEQLVTFGANASNTEKRGFVGRLSTFDESAMAKTFELAKEVVSAKGVMRTGLVGLNRMLGVGGFRRGELVNFGALTHNYKTGILNDLTRHIPLYNTPWMMDKDKKPLVLRMSFENKQEQDLPIIYRSLIEQATGDKIELSEIDPVKAARYVKDRLSVNGYEVAMECYDPNSFDVFDMIDVFNYYEAKGFEIHFTTVDYLELIAKHKRDRIDESINEVFEVARNHCFPKGITLCTAHQLSTEAVMIQREKTIDFVKHICDGGYYRNSKSLNTKLDCEILMHIEKRAGNSFLTFARGKHRGGDQTPERHRYFGYHFKSIGGIVDDVEKAVPEAIYDISKYIIDNNLDMSNDEDGPITVDLGEVNPNDEW